MGTTSSFISMRVVLSICAGMLTILLIEPGSLLVSGYRSAESGADQIGADPRKDSYTEDSMTTLKNRPNTALLVIDVQNGVVGEAHERDAVVANVGSLVEKARRGRGPVVWVPHSDKGVGRGGGHWRLLPPLDPGGAEAPLRENHRDLLQGTD